MLKILIKCILATGMLISLAACNNTINDDLITKADFYQELNKGLGIDGDNYLENLKDFGIEVDTSSLESYLTNEELLKVVENIDQASFNDLNERIKTNAENVSKELALESINKSIDNINSITFTDKIDGIQELEESEIKENISNEDLSLVTDEIYEIGDLVIQNEIYYKITKIEKKDLGFQYTMVEASVEDILEGVDLETSFDIDLSESEIEIENETSYQESNFKLLSSNYMSKQFTFEGFNIYYSVSGSGFHASASKQTANGLRLFAEYDLNNLKANFKWDYDGKKVKDAYLRFDYNTSQSIGVKANKYYDKFLDIKEIDGISSYDKLSSVFKSRQDLIENSFDLMTFKVPIPSCPLFTLKLKLQLHIYISGRVEFTIASQNQTGFEIKNNKIRYINETNKDLDFIIKSNVSTTMGLNFGLYCFNKAIADTSIEAGIKSYIKVTSHLYDGNGKSKKVASDFQYDLADYISEDNDEFLVCGDISLYYVGSLKFNTSKTLLSKLKLSKTFNLLDESNQILKNKMTHIENGHFVKKCSRNTTANKVINVEILDTDQIQLDKYTIVLREGESDYIRITGLPDGYTLNDLKVSSNNKDIVSCSSFKVIAHKKGASQVIVKTNDEIFQASVSILVMSG